MRYENEYKLGYKRPFWGTHYHGYESGSGTGIISGAGIRTGTVAVKLNALCSSSHHRAICDPKHGGGQKSSHGFKGWVDKVSGPTGGGVEKVSR